jgi:hypothetical protein
LARPRSPGSLSFSGEKITWRALTRGCSTVHRLDHLLHGERGAAVKLFYAREWTEELTNTTDPDLRKLHIQVAACRDACSRHCRCGDPPPATWLFTSPDGRLTGAGIGLSASRKLLTECGRTAPPLTWTRATLKKLTRHTRISNLTHTSAPSNLRDDLFSNYIHCAIDVPQLNPNLRDRGTMVRSV